MCGLHLGQRDGRCGPRWSGNAEISYLDERQNGYSMTKVAQLCQSQISETK